MLGYAPLFLVFNSNRYGSFDNQGVNVCVQNKRKSLQKLPLFRQYFYIQALITNEKKHSPVIFFITFKWVSGGVRSIVRNSLPFLRHIASGGRGV